MVTKEFTNLETQVKDHGQKNLDELTKFLRGDLSEAEVQLASEEQIDIIANLQDTWQKKLDDKKGRRGPWSSGHSKRKE